MERLEERIGLCNLPYETLRDDPSLLHEAYLQFLRLEDCNVAYNDTLEQVIDAIEQWLASGTLSPVNLPDFLLYKRSHHHSRYLPLHIHLRSKSF